MKTQYGNGPITLISPNLVVQKNDPFTTGIVYFPISLSWFAAAVKKAGHPVQVVDAFGEKPNAFVDEGEFFFRGLKAEEVLGRIDKDTQAIFFYAINLTYHVSLLKILKAVRVQFPKVPLIIMENSQAVTAYSLRNLLPELFDAGFDYVITGEPEERGVALIEQILAGAGSEAIAKIQGIAQRVNGNILYTEPKEKIKDLDSLPFPAHDLFPLKNYWKLGYAHGPLTSSRYLPLLTSRGCPYPCRFCVIPEMNDTRWRSRSANHVVDEIEHFQKTLGVSEFHIEDVDPTVSDVRTQAICREIIRRDLKITWKICSGTKVETLKSEETIDLMAQSGCRYVSISPESGSERILKLIKKPFLYDHAVRMIRKMSSVGIRTQACFVLGFPGEEDSDRLLTRKMARELVREGLDEIALFIITPVPGSAIFEEFSGYENYSQLNFSPTWRADYQKLNEFRVQLYRDFLFWKLRFHPLRLMKQPFNFLTRNFETKMEMAPYRALHTLLRAKMARQP